MEETTAVKTNGGPKARSGELKKGDLTPPVGGEGGPKRLKQVCR